MPGIERYPTPAAQGIQDAWVGAIVHRAGLSERCDPAIVVRVWSEDSLQLRSLGEHGMDVQTLSHSVEGDADRQTWHWPSQCPRVAPSNLGNASDGPR